MYLDLLFTLISFIQIIQHLTLSAAICYMYNKFNKTPAGTVYFVKIINRPAFSGRNEKNRKVVYTMQLVNEKNWALLSVSNKMIIFAQLLTVNKGPVLNTPPPLHVNHKRNPILRLQKWPIHFRPWISLSSQTPSFYLNAGTVGVVVSGSEI